MKNIKHINRVIILSIIILFLFGCGTSKNIYDKNIPKENTSQLIFQSSFQFGQITYNGIDMNLKRKLGHTGFTIPAGQAIFNFDLDLIMGTNQIYTNYKASNIEIRYNFEAGKKYFIWFQTRRDNDRDVIIGNVVISYYNTSYNKPENLLYRGADILFR